MNANGWAKGLMAASMGMVMLFTGNAASPPGTEPAESTGPGDSVLVESLVEVPTVEPTESWEDPGVYGVRAASADGEHIFVYDASEGSMRFCSGEDSETLYPASVTKLWSALVALMYLDPEEVVTAGTELKLVQPGSSRAYIARGSRLTAEMLVEGMLIPSGNDAAYVLAAAAGRVIAENAELGSEEAVAAFLEEMNRKGKEIGMIHSHFTNPDGYHDPEHYMCPRDVALVGSLALENSVIARYMNLQQDSVTFRSGEHIAWYNTNHLINPESPYYVEEAVGMKTGYTDKAGHCLLGAFRHPERTILVGIFGAKKPYSRYADAVDLYEIAVGG